MSLGSDVYKLKHRINDMWMKVNDCRDFSPEMLEALEAVEAVQIGKSDLTLSELSECKMGYVYDGEAGYFLYRLNKVYDALVKADSSGGTNEQNVKVMSDAFMSLEAAAMVLPA
jgi:hypothetical protein